MAHFAELDENNIVLQVIVVNNSDTIKNGIEDEDTGKQFCTNLLGGRWIQTSYNNSFRKKYAVIGMKYDENLDMFILPQPFKSWSLNSNGDWIAPIDKPVQRYKGLLYIWDENILNWVEYQIPSPFPSWTTLNSEYLWQPPIPYPTDGKLYIWNEESLNWIEFG